MDIEKVYCGNIMTDQVGVKATKRCRGEQLADVYCCHTMQ